MLKEIWRKNGESLREYPALTPYIKFFLTATENNLKDLFVKKNKKTIRK